MEFIDSENHNVISFFILLYKENCFKMMFLIILSTLDSCINVILLFAPCIMVDLVENKIYPISSSTIFNKKKNIEREEKGHDLTLK